MWVPESERDVLSAIDAGDLVETANFDAKSALPGKGKSKDLAVDVAAMSADGGTLLYGVAEDGNGRPTVPRPFGLAGARERVDQIVRTSVSEPPAIEVHEIPTEDDPSFGYLVVHVPASPRAPHMVTVGKELRYYGRGATGNAPLSEGEVARLYERRRRWAVDREAVLERAIEAAPIPFHEDFAYLHLVARPLRRRRRRQTGGGWRSTVASSTSCTRRTGRLVRGTRTREAAILGNRRADRAT